MEKKNWTTPELIVLVRNKLEEAVLTYCKGIGADGPTLNAVTCVDDTYCTFCSERMVS